jgi:threonine dehydratase
MVSLKDVREAAAIIGDNILLTPLMYSPTFSSMTGANVYLKLENLQIAGSFKVRGATNKIHAIQHRIGKSGVVAASAGNHAQGVAVAARQAGIPATIVMPETVSISKMEATRGYGANIVLKGQNLGESIRYAQSLSGEGMTFIHPFDDVDIIAGQGTIALEIFEDLPAPDVIVVPIGGGGLISGIAVATKAIRPQTRVVGVETAACPSAFVARKNRKPELVSSSFSIADGILVNQVGNIPYAIMEQTVDDIVLVMEDEISRAMLLLLDRKKQLAEGAGVVGLAALLSGSIPVSPGSNVVVVISGGNVDLPLLERIIRQGLMRDGRIMRLSVLIEDKPGELAGTLTVISESGGNVLHIHHARAESDLPINKIRVDIEVETRNRAHISEITGALKDMGYVVEVKK